MTARSVQDKLPSSHLGSLTPRTKGSEKSVISLCFSSAHRYILAADKTRHFFGHSFLFNYFYISDSASSLSILIRHRLRSAFITLEILWTVLYYCYTPWPLLLASMIPRRHVILPL